MTDEPTHRSELSGIAVLYALPDERRFFGNRYDDLTVIRAGGGAHVELDSSTQPSVRPFAYSLCIGVGCGNAYRNTSFLLEADLPVRAVIVVGFAGGLKAGLQPGSVVVADAILEAGSQRVYDPDSGLLDAAARVKLASSQVSRGLLATSDHVLVSAAEKQELARATGAIAVDMESAGAAAAAGKFGVPWLAVRVITDGVDDDLPFDFNAPEFKASADPHGGVDRGRIMANALRHPWKIPALIRLGARSSRAARNLAAFLHALFQELQTR